MIKLSSWKEIEIKQKTRWIVKKYNEILSWNVNLKFNPNNWADQDIELPAINISRAEEFLVSALSWLSIEELDQLSENDYNLILWEINDQKQFPWWWNLEKN